MTHESKIAAAVPPAAAARPVTGGGNPSALPPVTISEGTADLWRELVHLCMETPL